MPVLCEAANGVVQGQAQKKKLIVATKDVPSLLLRCSLPVRQRLTEQQENKRSNIRLMTPHQSMAFNYFFFGGGGGGGI